MAVKPLSSYPKEFFDVWTLAVAGTLVLEFPKRATAINLRTRLYAYRKRLDEASPLQAAPLKDVDLVVEPKDPSNPETSPWLLKGAVLPWKAQVREQLASLPQGAFPPAPLPPQPEPTGTFEPVLPDTMDSTLRNMGFGTGKQD